MSNDTKALAIIPRTVDDVRSLAKMFAQSALLPAELRGKEADVFVSIVAGQELGLPPMQALRNVHIIKGKPVMSADGMVGLCLGSGLAEYFSCIEEDDHCVTYETKRRGAPQPQRCTWTIEDAQRAGLMNNDNWRRYPRAMLKARCKAVLARDVYPDVLAGCYDTDEAREFSGPQPVPTAAPRGDVVDAEFTEVKETVKVEYDYDALCEAKTSPEELRELAKQFNAIPKGTKERAAARAAYDKRMAFFAQQAKAAQPQEGAA